MDNGLKENHVGHVHFSEDTDEIGHTIINVKEKTKNHYEVHVGFLQIFHKYKIVFTLPVKCSSEKYVLSDSKVNSLCVKIMEMSAKEENIGMSVEFSANKEKLMKEAIHLVSSGKEELTVTIFARVLGKGKGTPMLLEGVTCIAVENHPDESEDSDWQGFGSK